MVVPAAVRTELISVAHASHIGIEGCLRRMRECLYWPRMTTQVKDCLSKCEVCLSHRSAPPRETLQQHDFIARPWSKIGADLCQKNKNKKTKTKKQKQSMVLYSAVSSPLDRSKRFTLSSPGRPVHSDTVLGFSWKHSSHAAIAQRLFTHISTTVYSQVLIYTAESTEAS